MIKPGRQRCTFRLTRHNRIMLLEIQALSARIGEDMDISEIINEALKNHLPSLLAGLNRITKDQDLALLHRHIMELEEEYDNDIKRIS